MASSASGCGLVGVKELSGESDRLALETEGTFFDEVPRGHGERDDDERGGDEHCGDGDSREEMGDGLLDGEGVDVGAIGAIAEFVVLADDSTGDVGEVEETIGEGEPVDDEVGIAVEHGRRKCEDEDPEEYAGKYNFFLEDVEGGSGKEHVAEAGDVSGGEMCEVAGEIERAEGDGDDDDGGLEES